MKSDWSSATMSKASFHIIIVGAGVAGANAAICLASHGHSVTLLDYRSKLEGTFANSIHLYPNSARIVDKYGIWPILEAAAAPKVDIRYHRGDSGELVLARDADDYVKLYGYPSWQILREDYVPVIMDVVKQRGVKTKLGCRVQSIDTDAPAIVLDTGERLAADLIVGADGIRSTVRRLAIPGGDVPMSSSENAYICRVPKQLLLEVDELAFMMTEHAIWMSPNHIIVSAPFQDCLDITLLYREETGMFAGDWNVDGDLDEMKRHFQGYDARWRKVLSFVKYCKNWRIAELGSLKIWLSEKGNCVLIGDAGHAMVPAAAQEAGLAIEDGAALAECLDRADDVLDIPRVLKAFEAIRKPRAERVKAVARANMDMLMLVDPDAQQKRDEDWKLDPSNRVGHNFNNLEEEKQKEVLLGMSYWLLGYDVYESTNQELDKILVLSIG